jgi:selenocysteine lyase/cysteine desulfurase
MDDKWDPFFSDFIPGLRQKLGKILKLGDGATIAFAPNTHELVNRLFSTVASGAHVVTTDAEFHSVERQLRRWEEESRYRVTRVPAEPFDSFVERFGEEARAADIVYLSQVLFDSGFVVPHLEELIAQLSAKVPVVIDGYHAFMALPIEFGDLAERVFFVAGGYKYAMAGEGACFMHCPPSFATRPVDTGWYAGFGELTDRAAAVHYGPGGDAFWGATQDGSGLYRLDAVLSMLDAVALDSGSIHDHVVSLQQRLLGAGLDLGELLPPERFARGNFLVFRRDDAAATYQALHDRGIVTDYRRDRWRIGFGIYHSEEDVDQLTAGIRAIDSATASSGYS